MKPFNTKRKCNKLLLPQIQYQNTKNKNEKLKWITFHDSTTVGFCVYISFFFFSMLYILPHFLFKKCENDVLIFLDLSQTCMLYTSITHKTVFSTFLFPFFSTTNKKLYSFSLQKPDLPLSLITSTQSTSTSLSLSPSSSAAASSSRPSLKDEIYIDDEGIEGSGGRGEVSIFYFFFACPFCFFFCLILYTDF